MDVKVMSNLHGSLEIGAMEAEPERGELLLTLGSVTLVFLIFWGLLSII